MAFIFEIDIILCLILLRRFINYIGLITILLCLIITNLFISIFFLN